MNLSLPATHADMAGEMNKSYIDRLMSDVEKDGEEDDRSLDLGEVERNMFDEQEDKDVSSDEDEFEYDSDEDMSGIKILLKPSTTYSPSESLSEESKALLLWRLGKSFVHMIWFTFSRPYNHISAAVTTFGNPRQGRELQRLDNQGYYYQERRKGSHTRVPCSPICPCLGPKKSGYFETIFKSEEFKESTDKTSEVNLPEDVATQIPVLLDFLYCHKQESSLINRNNWRMLYYLADYFLIPALKDSIKEYVLKDMLDIKNLEGYLSSLSDDDDNMPEFILPNLTSACVQMILSIKVGSSLLSTIPPAMLLQVFITIRASKDIKSLSSNSEYHICNLAIDYIRTNKNILDMKFFYALADELYLPSDVRQAGLVAIDLLEIIEITKWVAPYTGIESMCVTALFEYLSYEASPHLDITKIEGIMKKIPKHISSPLLAIALSPKKRVLKRDLHLVVRCKIMSPDLGVPKGRIIKVSIKATDPIRRLEYLVSRQLNVAMPLSLGPRMEIYCRGQRIELAGNSAVSYLSINSETVLEIKSLFIPKSEQELVADEVSSLSGADSDSMSS